MTERASLQPQTLYMKHMRGMKQLELEAMGHSEPMLRLVATMANSSMEQRLAAGNPTQTDITMLEAAAVRAK